MDAVANVVVQIARWFALLSSRVHANCACGHVAILCARANFAFGNAAWGMCTCKFCVWTWCLQRVHVQILRARAPMRSKRGGARGAGRAPVEGADEEQDGQGLLDDSRGWRLEVVGLAREDGVALLQRCAAGLQESLPGQNGRVRWGLRWLVCEVPEPLRLASATEAPLPLGCLVGRPLPPALLLAGARHRCRRAAGRPLLRRRRRRADAG